MGSKIDKSFVSDVDQFLTGLRGTVPENDSQRKERKKYERIKKLRDSPQIDTKFVELWEDF